MVNVFDWRDYGNWLLDLVGFDSSRKGYLQLMHNLHFVEFKELIKHDRNRIKDGQELRKDYYDLTGVALWELPNHDIPERLIVNASVLEVLIALAFRIENEYIGDPADPNPEMIFWEMICNLGLQKYVGKYYDEHSVCDILETWISRRYSYNGRGGIFPLEYPKRDQRQIEIWDQMMAYLSEQYFN